MARSSKVQNITGESSQGKDLGTQTVLSSKRIDGTPIVYNGKNIKEKISFGMFSTNNYDTTNLEYDKFYPDTIDVEKEEILDFYIKIEREDTETGELVNFSDENSTYKRKYILLSNVISYLENKEGNSIGDGECDCEGFALLEHKHNRLWDEDFSTISLSTITELGNLVHNPSGQDIIDMANDDVFYTGVENSFVLGSDNYSIIQGTLNDDGVTPNEKTKFSSILSSRSTGIKDSSFATIITSEGENLNAPPIIDTSTGGDSDGINGSIEIISDGSGGYIANINPEIVINNTDLIVPVMNHITPSSFELSEHHPTYPIDGDAGLGEALMVILKNDLSGVLNNKPLLTIENVDNLDCSYREVNLKTNNDGKYFRVIEDYLGTGDKVTLVFPSENLQPKWENTKILDLTLNEPNIKSIYFPLVGETTTSEQIGVGEEITIQGVSWGGTNTLQIYGQSNQLVGAGTNFAMNADLGIIRKTFRAYSYENNGLKYGYADVNVNSCLIYNVASGASGEPQNIIEDSRYVTAFSSYDAKMFNAKYSTITGYKNIVNGNDELPRFLLGKYGQLGSETNTLWGVANGESITENDLTIDKNLIISVGSTDGNYYNSYINANYFNIINVKTPVNNNDAVNKGYADGLVNFAYDDFSGNYIDGYNSNKRHVDYTDVLSDIMNNSTFFAFQNSDKPDNTILGFLTTYVQDVGNDWRLQKWEDLYSGSLPLKTYVRAIEDGVVGAWQEFGSSGGTTTYTLNKLTENLDFDNFTGFNVPNGILPSNLINKSQLDSVTESIANLLSASGQIMNDDTTPIILTNSVLSYDVIVDSSDTEVIEFDETTELIQLKKAGNYNLSSTVTISSETNTENDIYLLVLDDEDDSVIFEQVVNSNILPNKEKSYQFNALIKISEGDEPITIKLCIKGTTTGMTLKSFNSILSYHNSTGGGLTPEQEALFIKLDNMNKFQSLNGFDRYHPETMGDISFDYLNRAFMIRPNDDETQFSFVTFENIYIKTNPEQIQISDVTGTHFIYYDETGELRDTTIFTDALITKYAIVSIIYWNSEINKEIIFADERHGIAMDGETHLELHNTIGAYYRGGFNINGLSNNSTSYTSIDSGKIADEDIQIDVDAVTNTKFLYKLGSNWNVYGATDDTNLAPLDTYTLYNPIDDNGFGTLEQGHNNKYYNMFIIVTNDIENPIRKVLGQKEYDTKNLALDDILNSVKQLSLIGLPTPEFKFLYGVVVNSDGELVEFDNGDLYLDLRTDSFNDSGVSTTGGGILPLSVPYTAETFPIVLATDARLFNKGAEWESDINGVMFVPQNAGIIKSASIYITQDTTSTLKIRVGIYEVESSNNILIMDSETIEIISPTQGAHKLNLKSSVELIENKQYRIVIQINSNYVTLLSHNTALNLNNSYPLAIDVTGYNINDDFPTNLNGASTVNKLWISLSN